MAIAGVLVACAPLESPERARSPESVPPSVEQPSVGLNEPAALEAAQARVTAPPVAIAPVAKQVALLEASDPPRPVPMRVTAPASPCEGRTGVFRVTAPSNGSRTKLGGTLTSPREALDKRCAPTSRIAPTQGATTTDYPPPMSGFTPHFRADW